MIYGRTKNLAAVSNSLSVAALVAMITAAAGVLAAENSTNPENSLLPDQPAASHRSSILARLLTWPEKEKQG